MGTMANRQCWGSAVLVLWAALGTSAPHFWYCWECEGRKGASLLGRATEPSVKTVLGTKAWPCQDYADCQIEAMVCPCQDCMVRERKASVQGPPEPSVKAVLATTAYHCQDYTEMESEATAQPCQGCM